MDPTAVLAAAVAVTGVDEVLFLCEAIAASATWRNAAVADRAVGRSSVRRP